MAGGGGGLQGANTGTLGYTTLTPPPPPPLHYAAARARLYCEPSLHHRTAGYYSQYSLSSLAE